MEEDECNIGLGLAIGGGRLFTSNKSRRDGGRKPPVQFHSLFPPRPKEEEEEEEEELVIGERHARKKSSSKNVDEEEEDTGDINNQVPTRKKLRLTIEQLTLLENSFREHITLNPIQKQELAEQLNLRPRQVEVWFQNRRARTKLKQTEVDCEFLKKWCENLSNENQRLKRELEELKSMEPRWPFYIRVPKATTLTMCPSCERVMAAGSEKGSGGVMDAINSPLAPGNNGLVSL